MATEALFRLIKNLWQFDKIIVTGAQRSGTTIGMLILAEELGYEGIKEEEIDVDNLNLFSELLNKRRFALQAPGLCSITHLLRGKDTAVVFMKRKVEDILASEKRIGWNVHEPYEKAKYFTNDEEPISATKLFNWEVYQKPLLLERAFDLEYDSLKGHQLFIENRTGFGARQTQ